jgi:hypothetical protein
MTGPMTYDEATGGKIADQMDRYRELADHDIMARSIAILKGRGTFEPNEHVNDEKFPPLTAAGYLEMLALGDRIARYYRHPSQVHHAVLAGATWGQIAAAAGGDPDQARKAYREWTEGQHRLRRDFPGGTIGLGDEEYAAAIEAAGGPHAALAPGGAAEDTRRLKAIREVLDRFNWEFDDRQYVLEAIERIADGGQP